MLLVWDHRYLISEVAEFRSPKSGNVVTSKYYGCSPSIQRYRGPVFISSRCLLRSPTILPYRVHPLAFPDCSGLAFTLLLSFFIGLQVVVMRRFDFEKWLKAVQDYGVTYAHVAPPISISRGQTVKSNNSGVTC